MPDLLIIWPVLLPVLYPGFRGLMEPDPELISGSGSAVRGMSTVWFNSVAIVLSGRIFDSIFPIGHKG